MERITSFMLFDNLENIPSPDGKKVSAHLINPLPMLRPQFIPTNFSFALSVSASGIDLTKPGSIKLQILNPDDSLLKNFEEIKTPVFEHGVSKIPEEYCGFTLNMKIQNISLRTEGIYKLKVNYNGKEIGEEKIPVFKWEEPGDEN